MKLETRSDRPDWWWTIRWKWCRAPLPARAITSMVTIDSGATLALAGDITVSGNWTNNGTFISNGFTVTLTARARQTIGGFELDGVRDAASQQHGQHCDAGAERFRYGAQPYQRDVRSRRIVQRRERRGHSFRPARPGTTLAPATCNSPVAWRTAARSLLTPTASVALRTMTSRSLPV